MPGRYLFPVVLLASLAEPLLAELRLPAFGEVVDVRVINLEVVVTDGGERVRGLSPTDFRLEADGAPVPIEFFTEIAGGKTIASKGPGSAPSGEGEGVGTHVLVFVDDYFALPGERNRVLAAIARELPRLGPDDRMAIVAFDGRRLELLAGWTRSLPKLQTALEQARGRAAFGLQWRGEQRRFDSNLRLGPGTGFSRTGFAGSYTSRQLEASGLVRAKEVAAQVTRVVTAGSAALRGLATAPGRKVMLMLAGGWPISPAVWQTGALEEPGREDGLIEGRKLLAPLVETANRLGYTLYPIDVPGNDPSRIDADRGGIPSIDGQELGRRREEIERDALGTLAARTGGRVLLGGAQLAPLEHLLRDLEHYYWLGFVPRWERDGRTHTVRVKLARPGLAARARAGFLDLARSAEVSMLLESAQLFDQPLPEAGILALTLKAPKPAARGRMRLPIELSAPWEELTLVPAPGGLAADLELRAVAVDEEGEISNVPLVPVRLTRPSPAPAGERFVYALELELRRREQSLLVALYEPASGKLLAARAQVLP